MSAPELSPDERATVERFEAAEAAPESWRPVCDSRGPRIGSEGVPRCRRTKGHDGEHRPAPEDGWGNVTWSDLCPVTARPVGDGDDLWERIATALEVAGPMTPTLEAQLRAALLPVVRDWAAGQLRAAADEFAELVGSGEDFARWLRENADALAADDRIGQR